MFCKDSYLSSDRWVFDELHKYRQWRNYLKGLYDQYRTSKGILYRSHFGFSPKVMFGGSGIIFAERKPPEGKHIPVPDEFFRDVLSAKTHLEQV